MKLFVYHDSGFNPESIHAIKYLTNKTHTLCDHTNSYLGTISFTYLDYYDKKDYLDTTRPFCTECERLLEKDYNINMKQLAINQKLGVK